MSSQHLSEPSSSSSYHRANMMITLLLLLNIISSLNGGAVSPKDASEDEPSEIQSTLDQDSRSNETSIKEHKSNNHDLSESIPNVSKSEASMDSVGEETKRPQRPRQSAKRTKQMRNKPAATETDRNSDTEPALAFDPSYFASLNAANHRPVQSASSLPLSHSSPAVSIEGLPGNESENLFYYSPETYGKLSHRNHQNTAFTFTYGGQTTPQTVPILKPMATPSTSSVSDSSNSQLQVSSTTSGSVSLDGPEKSKSNESPVKPVIVTVDKTKPKIKNLMQESNTTQSPAVQSGGTKKKEKDTLSSYINDKFHSGPLNPEPYDDAPTYEVGDGNTNSAEKYYYQDPFMVSMTRSKTLNPKQGKPYRYPDIVPVGETGGSGQGSPPTAPLTDYVEEDYESPDSYSDFKNLPMIKSALSSPKYVGPAPYRYPPYTSYYPTRFYAPYDGETAPGKSQSSGVNSWSGLAGFLLGILPLGILMASMVPAFVSVPVASAAAGVGRKKRSLSRHDQMTKLIEKYEKTMVKSEICVKQFLCNALRHSSSDTNNKPYYTSIERLKSTKLFRFFKMNEILRAAKGDRCDQTFKCKRRPLK